MVNAPIARHPTKRKEMAIVDSGKHAVTHYQTLETFGDSTAPLASKIECKLDTGRTHQIRVHMRSLRCPMIGDATYGMTRTQAEMRILATAKSIFPPPDNEVLVPIQMLERQALHAHQLQFLHPVTGQEIHCSAPLPYDLVMLENSLVTLTNRA
jgi:23S rRNA pseudouridine1911/1915/1917 synthase